MDERVTLQDVKDEISAAITVVEDLEAKLVTVYRKAFVMMAAVQELWHRDDDVVHGRELGAVHALAQEIEMELNHVLEGYEDDAPEAGS